MTATDTQPHRVTPGLGDLRPAPAGMPDPAIAPPIVAESNDPFAAVRVIDLLARVERGRPIRLADLTDRLNATWLDWLFSASVVADVIIGLQANWMTDYRNSSGIVLEDSAYGATVEIEDSTRVDPWIAAQAEREAARCRQRLAEFARRDTLGGG
ncbi:MAG TPA: hypothetical protein VH720_14710 [Candidatus Limnocylindrales bacterium]